MRSTRLRQVAASSALTGLAIAIWKSGRLSARHERDAVSPTPHGNSNVGRPARVSIVSQNMWNSFYSGGPHRAQRMEAFKMILAESAVPAEIVVLQEMFAFGLGPLCEKSEVHVLQNWMTELGFVYQTSPIATLPWLGQSSGLLICCKQPILSEKHHIFQQRRRVTAKGWLEVEVELPSMKLVIITTHLEHAHTTYCRRVRASQWRELAERIKALKEDHVILLGDFNVCGEDFGQALDDGQEFHALLTVMEDAGLTHGSYASLSHPPDRPTLRTPEVSKLASSPDHIFVSSKLKDRALKVAIWDTSLQMNTAKLEVSDHRALIAQFDA